jgi:aspartyl/asparaginyl-tRNA synthetase
MQSKEYGKHLTCGFSITNGAYVALIGQWIPSQGAGQSHELRVDEIETIGEGNTLVRPSPCYPLADCFSLRR